MLHHAVNVLQKRAEVALDGRIELGLGSATPELVVSQWDTKWQRKKKQTKTTKQTNKQTELTGS
jgi:hypothetical protein